MRRPSLASQPNRASRGRGFILLYTLWVLLGGAVLFAALSAASISRSRSAASELASLKGSGALETAVHASAFELLAHRQAPSNSPTTRSVSVGDMVLTVEVVDQAGLVDVNTASAADLGILLKKLGLHDAELLASAIVRARPVIGLWQLAPVLGVGTEQLDCLAPLLTFSSGLSRPEPQLTPTRLARILELPPKPSSQQGIGINLPGSGMGYLISAQTSGSQGRGGAITAAVILGRRGDRPVLVTDWYRSSFAPGGCPWSR